MKSKILLTFLLGAFFCAQSFAQTGGPDDYGYYWKDITAADGPDYNWVEITGSGGTMALGTKLGGLGDDNAAAPFDIGFEFQYYWNKYDKIQVGTNGWLSFNTSTGNVAHCFPDIPEAGGQGDDMICPFLTDLNFAGTSTGEIWYWTNNVDSLVVTYLNAPWWINATPDWNGSNTFQVVLNGADNSISFYYEDMDPGALNNTAGCAQDLIIGIENVTGDIGLKWDTEIVPGDQYAIRYYYPDSVTFEVADATPVFVTNADNKAQFVVTEIPLVYQTIIKNVGNGDLPSSSTVEGSLQTFTFSELQAWSATIDPLGANLSEAICFDPTFELATDGQYRFIVTVDNADDLNQNNNVVEVEVDAITWNENTCSNLTLGYVTTDSPGNTELAAFGIDDGVGVHIVPPAYPITINAVENFVRQMAADIGNNGEYTVEIYDDNGPDGAPGSLLTSEVVAMGSYVPEAWVNTPLTSPVTIDDGGFYIAWIQRGDSTALGTDGSGPKSLRTYEVIAGSWATYRSAKAEDFMIRAIVDGCGATLALDTACTAVSVDQAISKPNFNLSVFPNPNNGQATIEFEFNGKSNESRLSIMNLHGQVIENVEYGSMAAGTYRKFIDTSNLPNGIYIVQLEQSNYRQTVKMVVSK